jgi:hypothetical protein
MLLPCLTCPAACARPARAAQNPNQREQSPFNNIGDHQQVWNPRTGACTATVDTGYGLSLLWAPGNRHAVVGTKVLLLPNRRIPAPVPSAHSACAAMPMRGLCMHLCLCGG